MKKIIKFDQKMIDEIKKIADREFEGNFSMAVRKLVEVGIYWDCKAPFERKQELNK